MDQSQQAMQAMQPVQPMHMHPQPGEGRLPDSGNASQNRWLRGARYLWIIIVVAAYALWLTQLPAYLAAASHHPVAGEQPIPFGGAELTLADVQQLHTWGLSIELYAVGVVAITLLFQLGYAAAGLLLFWRRADDRIALFASFALMMLPFAFAPLTLQSLPPGWLWIIPAFVALGNASLILCGYIFPDGRFVPKWVRWLAVALVGYSLVVVLFPTSPLDRSWVSIAIFVVFGLSVLPIQWYRYRAVATSYQRQQTKWAVLGMMIAVLGNVFARLLYAFVLAPHWQGQTLAYMVNASLIMIAMLAIPVSVTTAILFSHLWDIDLVIKRTLLYSALTTLLAALYVGSVIVLQTLTQLFTGQRRPEPLVIAGSTLLVAAVTNPLRRWLQAVIDRRFYRHRYRTERVLTAFADTLHSEVELGQLNERLVRMIHETMEPSHISLWLAHSDADSHVPAMPHEDQTSGVSPSESL